ncbi:hypothetical protein SAMN05661044_01600 [Olivibacter domesticus]|uniref:Uncharacterized protein n=1 Tax=Olivibacter domesticus TaxID=407022 RepID=A0A1H7LBA7_OLID1|nr:hypothetical protein SAMN05661044_01600 [Olivibacter domesticus]
MFNIMVFRLIYQSVQKNNSLIFLYLFVLIYRNMYFVPQFSALLF